MTDLRAIDEAAWLAKQKPGRWETAAQVLLAFGIVALLWVGAISALAQKFMTDFGGYHG